MTQSSIKRDYGKVAVVMGGDSAEREISLLSGTAVLHALQRQGVDAHGVDAGPDVIQLLDEDGFERVFIMLHGRGGEDGVIQGALERVGLPYTGSGVLGSALGMDKYRCKLLWQGAGLPTPASILITGEADLEAAAALGFPLIVKPSHEGSSIGMSKVGDALELAKAWGEASEYDSAVLAERWIVGREYTAAILAGQALPLIKLETPHVFYDYAAKYLAETTQYHCPCGLPPERERALQSLALEAFELVGARGWGRVDMMLDEADQPWLIEVNTVPGMTDHSLVPMAAKQAGIGFDELVMRILDSSIGGATE
jgi:D-alanine-D-alanine ligase